MRLTLEQKSEILRLKFDEKLSSREIARRVLGSSSKKSTINDYLKRIPTIQEKPVANILLIDIETSPCIAYYWKRWKENIHESQAIAESFLLTYSAKWLGSDEIMYANLTPDEVDKEDDSRLCMSLHLLLSEADIVIAHNGIKFDIPVINTRLIKNGFTEPLPYKLVDTLAIAKRHFRFPSNSLATIAKYLGVTMKTCPNGGFELWKGYMRGNSEAISNMIEYNINDVVVLEEVYLKLRSWDKYHPSITVYSSNDIACPICNSNDIHSTDTYSYTNISAFKVLRCSTCGKLFRERKRSKFNNNSFYNV